MSEVLSRRDARAELFPVLIVLLALVLLRRWPPLADLLAAAGPLGPSLPLLALVIGVVIWLRLRRRPWAAAGLHFPRSVFWMAAVGLAALGGRLALGDFFAALDPAPAGAVPVRFAGLDPATWPFFLFLGGMWLTVWGEEVLHRGFILPRIAVLLGDTRLAWAGAVVLGAGFFGLGHAALGPWGMAAAAAGAVVYALAYLLGGRSIWPALLAHGGANTATFLTL